MDTRHKAGKGISEACALILSSPEMGVFFLDANLFKGISRVLKERFDNTI